MEFEFHFCGTKSQYDIFKDMLLITLPNCGLKINEAKDRLKMFVSNFMSR